MQHRSSSSPTMSSKRSKKEEYDSDEDDDFVPDVEVEEDQEELSMDDNEDLIEGKRGKKSRKRKDARKAGALSMPKIRKGPFDSDDDLSEPETTDLPEDERDPPAKRPKLEEDESAAASTADLTASSTAEDFYAAMMQGASSKSRSTSTISPTSPTPRYSASTTVLKDNTQDLDDPNAFFELMKKGTSSKSPATIQAESSSKSSSESKLAIPSSWMSTTKVSSTAEAQSPSSGTASPSLTGPQTVTVKERYEFAGEQIEVERKVDAKEAAAIQAKSATASGLGGLLGQLRGKNKITTLQKSKIDWVQYTEESGLEDEFVKNRKDGYIQKKEFLQNAEAAETAAYLAGKARAGK